MRRLSAENRARVSAAVDRLAETEEGDVTRLIDVRPPQWRLRVGEVRVLFEFQGSDVLHVLHVLPRGRTYREESIPYGAQP